MSRLSLFLQATIENNDNIMISLKTWVGTVSVAKLLNIKKIKRITNK